MARASRVFTLAPLLGAVIAVGLAKAADPPGTPGIYTCTDDKGRRLTSDRPIPECLAREQRVLNRDGSVRNVVPPTPTADERAEREAAERQAARVRAEQGDAVRRDRNLMTRFPDEATHRKAREAALDTVRAASKTTELRLRELAEERKPLLEEAEFYKRKTLPARLKQQLDANDAAVEAQRSAAITQSAEMVRVNKLYDLELERLKKLWAGAPPGSLGPAPSNADAAAAAATSASTPAAAGARRPASAAASRP